MEHKIKTPIIARYSRAWVRFHQKQEAKGKLNKRIMADLRKIQKEKK